MGVWATLTRPIRVVYTASRQTWKSFATKNPALSFTLSALAWLPMGIVFTENFATLKVVTGRSMQPTLNPDDSKYRDIVTFDRLSIRVSHDWKRGDIVAVWSPDEAKLLVKRIVALPGDKVKTLPPYPDPEVIIPVGHVWVEGDESYHTDDSNRFGPVPLALLDSKLSFIVWPWGRVGPLTEPTLPKADVPRGPAWRRQMDAVERARRREARVTPGHKTSDI